MSRTLQPSLFVPRETGAFKVSPHWYLVRDADPLAMALYARHYSCHHYRDGRSPKKFVGPGEHLVLITGDADALFVWRRFINAGGEEGVNCAVFRNEGSVLSSTLIREACGLAWCRWPGERLYTYVNAGAVRSANPGYCFKWAGWRTCGRSAGGLVILEMLPQTEPGCRWKGAGG